MSQAVPHEPICEDFPINPYCAELSVPVFGKSLRWDLLKVKSG